MILIDTHVLVWLWEGSPKLGARSRRLIDRAQAKQQLLVSAISFWEVATLVHRARLRLDVHVGTWRRDLLADGVREVAIDGRIGVEAAQLAGLHGDRADRLIVATAVVEGADLVTADAQLLDWRGAVRRLDARD